MLSPTEKDGGADIPVCHVGTGLKPVRAFATESTEDAETDMFDRHEVLLVSFVAGLPRVHLLSIGYRASWAR